MELSYLYNHMSQLWLYFSGEAWLRQILTLRILLEEQNFRNEFSELVLDFWNLFSSLIRFKMNTDSPYHHLAWKHKNHHSIFQPVKRSKKLGDFVYLSADKGKVHCITSRVRLHSAICHNTVCRDLYYLSLPQDITKFHLMNDIMLIWHSEQVEATLDLLVRYVHARR